MTNPTTNPDLIAAIKKLDKHVPAPKHVDLEKQFVYGNPQGPISGINKTVTIGSFCPPACEAAVVMYWLNLKSWWESTEETCCELEFDPNDESWWWSLGSKQGMRRDKVDAAIALIIAIAASLEE